MTKRLLISILLGLLVVWSACYKEADHQPEQLASYDDSTHVLQDTQSILADSISVAKIVIELPYNADSTKCGVTITTDLGTFRETNTQTVTLIARNNVDSLHKIAVANLKSGNLTGTAHILCTFTTQVRTLTVNFTASLPDFLNLSSNTISIQPNTNASGEVVFTCKLLKQNGTVSQRTPINLTVLDSNSHTIGSFRSANNLSDASGQTQFVYVLGDSVANGNFYYGRLEARATGPQPAQGLPATASLFFYSHK